MRKNKFMKVFAMVAIALMMLCPSSADISWAVEADANTTPAIEQPAAQDGDTNVDEEQPAADAQEPAEEPGDEEEIVDIDEEEVISDEADLATNGNALSGDVAAQNLSGDYYLSGDVTLTGDLTVARGTTATIDLNGHKLSVNGHSIDNKGTLTIKDVHNATVVESAGPAGAGNLATYSNGTLTYNVTKPVVTNKSTGATTDTTYKYTVTNMGHIVGSSSNAIKNSGTLNLDGGYICGGSTAAIYSTSGTVNLNGTVIAAVSRGNDTDGGAMYVSGGTLNLKGGIITGNKAGKGAGIFAKNCSMNMPSSSTTYITQNYGTTSGWGNGGGGMALENVKFVMGDPLGDKAKPTPNSNGIFAGGFITGNKSKGTGGGYIMKGGSTIMNGGFVSSNVAVEHEGGGITVHNGGFLTVNGGYVTNNELGGTPAAVAAFQHWGGGGIFCTDATNTTVKLLNTLITNNKADGFGAGVAGCSTGRVTIVDNAAIFDNDAHGTHISGSGSSKNEDHKYAFDDPVFMENGYDDFFCALSSTVSSKMLGGGDARWHGSVDGTVVEESENQTISAGYVVGLTANPTNPASAKAAATAFINGNFSATHGGGILSNGYLIVGDTDEIDVNMPLEVEGTKALLGVDGTTKSLTAGAYNFSIRKDTLNGEEVTTGTNDAKGNITFDNKISFKVEDKNADDTKKNEYRFVISEDKGNDTNIHYDNSIYVMDITTRIDNEIIKLGSTEITKHVKRMSAIKITRYDNGEISGTGTVVYNQSNISNDEAHGIRFDNLPNSPASKVKFTNEEIVPGAAVLEAHKTLEGASLEDYHFSFLLLDADNNDEELQTKECDAEGNVTFDSIPYNAVGTYNYKIKEVVGQDDNIIYDETVYTAVVTVTKDGKNLAASVEYKDAEEKTINKPEFTNKYAGPDTVVLTAQKILVDDADSGRILKDQEFEFQLLDASNNEIQTVKNDGQGTVTFDEIEYTAVGTYNYTIKEVATEDEHITVDTTIYKAVVTVAVDRETKNLKATVVYKNGEEIVDDAIFTNHYKPTATEIQLDAEKVLNDTSKGGKQLKAGEFTFELLENGSVIQEKKNDAEGKVTFDKISYNKAGTHTYTVREVKVEDDNIEYDLTVYTATVKVARDGDELKAAKTIKNGVKNVENIVFTNEYTPAPVSKALEAEKILADPSKSGRTLQAGEFTFKLYEGDKELETQTNDAKGHVAFGAIEYTEVGTHTYKVEEIKGDDEGHIVYDATVYTATVNVTLDEANNKLVASVSYNNGTEDVDSAVFTNEYTPDPTTAQLHAKKIISGDKKSGKKIKAGDFTFDLYEGEEVIQTKQNDANGNVAFDAIKYDKAGTYTYTVKEKGGNNNHFKYDQTEYTADVEVTKAEGSDDLVAKTTYKKGEDTVTEIVFDNEYAPTPTEYTLKANKTLEGRTLKPSMFQFTLFDADGKLLQTKTNTTDADGNVTFDALSFDKAGTYTYTVNEYVENPDAHYVYDGTVYTATIEVTLNDNEDALVAEATYKDGEKSAEAMNFKNVYSPDNTSIQLMAHKTLKDKKTDEEMPLVKNFQFKLTDADNDRLLDTKENNGEGDVTFAPITYTKNDIGKTFHYTINEVKGPAWEEDFSVIDYDLTIHDVTVEVTADEDGKIVTNITDIPSDASKYKDGKYQFTNYYTERPRNPRGQVDLVGQKLLDGDTLNAGQFHFNLIEVVDGVETIVREDVTNDNQGAIDFGTLVYEDEAAIGTHNMIVREIVADDADKTFFYDREDKTFTITVTRTSPTELSVVADKQPIVAEFNNTKLVPIATQFEAKKSMADEDLRGPKKDEFTFMLCEVVDGKYQKDDALQIKTCDADGKVTFDEITYDKTTDVGNHEYAIVEVVPSDDDKNPLIVYDDSEIRVNVTVSLGDDNKTLSVTDPVYTKNNEPINDAEFVNDLNPDDVTTHFEATKALCDPDGNVVNLRENEFSFVVVPDKSMEFDAVDGEEPDPEIIARGSNDATGKVVFSDITYNEDHVNRTFYYIIKEVKGDDEGHITYDETNYKAQVEVTFDADRDVLVATPTVTKDGEPVDFDKLTFTNEYKPDPTSVTLEADKKLLGRTLTDGEFTFVLLDKDGNEIDRSTNDASGHIKFNPAKTEYTSVGEYDYTIKEIKGDDEDITYDTKSYKVHVSVTLNPETRLLEAKISGLGDGIVFVNKYNPPDNPKTGDHMPIFPIMGLMLASLAGVFAALFRRKKEA
ncbi:MAG: LPXTG cell wall anchor domain-containing protein [Eubacterium sp.]|nr:LPXTG cell wall anchor domain-containing protein [Candidatus Colimonas fimequi]